MENINDILRDQNNTGNSLQNVLSSGAVAQTPPMQPTKPKHTKKSIVIRVIAAVAICIALVAGFFVYKTVRVNNAFSRVAAADSPLGEINADDAKYVILNPEYPIFGYSDEEIDMEKTLAYSTAVKNAKDFKELKRYYVKSRDFIDTLVATYCFVDYSMKHKLEKEELDYICNAIDKCIIQGSNAYVSEDSGTAYEFVVSMARYSMYADKYCVVYYQGQDTQTVEKEIFDFLKTQPRVSQNKSDEEIAEKVKKFVNRKTQEYDEMRKYNETN